MKTTTHHLPVVLLLPEERLLGAHALIPTSDQLTVVGHSAVLVLGGVVAQMQHFAALLLVGGSEHKACRLVEKQEAFIPIDDAIATTLPAEVSRVEPFLGTTVYRTGRCNVMMQWTSLHHELLCSAKRELFIFILYSNSS